MRKAIFFVLGIALILNFLSTPFQYLNLKEKITLLTHKDEFKKLYVQIDSTRISRTEGSTRGGSRSALTYYLYYENNNYLTLLDASDAILNNQQTELQTRRALEYMNNHNDSLLIWYHPTMNGRVALKEEFELNTNGFVSQVIINSFLLAVAIFSVVLQIKEWRKPKEK